MWRNDHVELAANSTVAYFLTATYSIMFRELYGSHSTLCVGIFVYVCVCVRA